MADLEKRLVALEKHVMADRERWATLDEHIKAQRLVLRAIVASLKRYSSTLPAEIIQALRAFEEAAKMTNEHTAVIQELRLSREIFERLVQQTD